MSVSRRVVISFGVLLLLAFAPLANQVWTVIQMQRANEELSKESFVAADELLRMKEAAFDLDGATRKYFIPSDPEHRAEILKGLYTKIGTFEESMRALAATKVGSAQEAGALRTAFIDYRARLEVAQHSRDLPLPLEASVARLRSQSEAAYAAALQDIREQVERNRAVGSRAETLSMIAGGAFLLAAIAFAYLMLRSINKPLQELTHGTRNISGGTFTHRLPESGPLEFAELARDFNQMAERLGELDRMKKDFVSHVSHELKAPLAAIRQTLAVTIEGVPGPINDQQRRLLQLSRNAAERLSAMVANLLDVSRIEAGSMEYEMGPHDLHKLVQTVVDEFSLKAEERRIQIVVAGDGTSVPVTCDWDRMIQVVGNLVDNALKFSPTDRTIDISLHRNGDSMITLAIADRGPGVPDAHKQAVFEKFHQVKGGGKRAAGQGVGLGLAICRTIVDAHRGRIWVTDNPGGGSVFQIEMHAARVQEAAKCG